MGLCCSFHLFFSHNACRGKENKAVIRGGCPVRVLRVGPGQKGELGGVMVSP